MDRWDWMVARAYAPAVLVAAGSLAATWVIAGWQQSPYLAGMVGVARWVPVAGFAFALAFASWVTYRLWRADQGEGLLCECGGLLGAERNGRYGPYRRCLACSRNVAARHYE